MDTKVQQDFSNFPKGVPGLGFKLRSDWSQTFLVLCVPAFYFWKENKGQRLSPLSEPRSSPSGKGCFLASGGVLLLRHVCLLPPCATSLLLFFQCWFVCPYFVILYLLWCILYAISGASLDLWQQPCSLEAFCSSPSASLTSEVLISWENLLGFGGGGINHPLDLRGKQQPPPLRSLSSGLTCWGPAQRQGEPGVSRGILQWLDCSRNKAAKSLTEKSRAANPCPWTKQSGVVSWE